MANKFGGEIAVSSDCEDMLFAAEGDKYRFSTIRRPEHLDDVGKMSQIRDAAIIMEHRCGIKFDPIIDLDITNPMRTFEDVQKAVNLLCDHDSVVSVVKARRNPYFNQVEKGQIIEKKVLRSQDAPEVYDLNCNIYVYERDFLMKNDYPVRKDSILYLMPDHTFCDIDTELDWQIVTMLMEKYGYVEKASD